MARKTSAKPAGQKSPSRRSKSTKTAAKAPVRAARKPTPRRKPRSSPSPKRPAGGASASGPGALRVRMYRIGFGDFFLVTVPSAAGPKHILIDCGVHAKDIQSIEASVGQMAAETQGKLALVIMTHRHADHISGFSKCRDVFSQFAVERVWMSWFEDRQDKKVMAMQANVARLAAGLRLSLAARRDPRMDEALRMVDNITGGTLGAAGSNDDALDMLHSFKGTIPDTKVTPDYYKAGDKPTLPQSLADAGLTAQILGPPTDPALIRKMNNKSEEYLAADMQGGGRLNPFLRDYRIAAARYPKAALAHLTRSEVERRIALAQPDTLAAAAEQANNFINNQSLIVLFGFNGKSLLFAGDAQWGNWANFLFGGAAGTALTPESKAILGNIDFYKVGHHGSTNATPKDALAAMREGCVAMCSTAEKAYKGVPRRALMTAIRAKTHKHLARSDQIKAGATAKDSAAGTLPAGFTKTSNDLFGYIDYEL